MTTPEPNSFPKAYEHGPIEERIYRTWMEKGFFTPTIQTNKSPFVIIMPPPNVTGELHLGHAITATIEDALARWHRMRGEPTLWLPGTDHAGIATQVVVERMLEEESSTTRHELGREKFIELVWEWVHKYGNIITRQLQRLGASCDWSREKFTLDPGPAFAVRTTFVNLFRKGLIYRGERVINWCPRCSTALSDLEVKHTDQAGLLYYIRYELENEIGHLTVATTRPETLFGDTGVAINPTDDRYQNIPGKRVLLPIIKRPIPIIVDEAVDKSFGSGALKVTPGHDPTDFEIGQRQGLSVLNVMNLDGTLNEEAGPYKGWDRNQARHAIVDQLRLEGLLERVEDHQMALGHCTRCDTVVEPMVSKQWFVQTKPLAARAIEVVKEHQIKIIPKRFTQVYLNWLENIRDWCISRQLWWGHRIPVWYCTDCDGITVDIEDPSKCSSCDSMNIIQDPDVLDTWFSSALWPHSTLGWPEQTPEMNYFYPGTVMETGYDILFFWVARMIMMGLENTGEIPFRTVYLHGLVRDAHGTKMSKSRGNVIDPLEAIDKYGADALRFAITTGTTPGNDSRLSEDRLETARNFSNKLWNAGRYVASTIKDMPNLEEWSTLLKSDNREDRWILSRYQRLIQKVDKLLKDYQFGEAERNLYEFIWGEFCDWYVEMAKIRLRNGDNKPIQILTYILEGTLRLLHPFMPFITEELWQRITKILPQEKNSPPSIMIAPYPKPQLHALDSNAERDMDLVTDIIRSIRNIRAEFNVEPKHRIEAWVSSDSSTAIIEEEAEAIKALARVDPLHILSDKTPIPKSNQTVTLVVRNSTVYLPMSKIVNLEKEHQRLETELKSYSEVLTRLEGHLQDKQFLSKAPADVIERERDRYSATKEHQNRIRELLKQLDA